MSVTMKITSLSRWHPVDGSCLSCIHWCHIFKVWKNQSNAISEAGKIGENHTFVMEEGVRNEKLFLQRSRLAASLFELLEWAKIAQPRKTQLQDDAENPWHYMPFPSFVPCPMVLWELETHFGSQEKICPTEKSLELHCHCTRSNFISCLPLSDHYR